MLVCCIYSYEHVYVRLVILVMCGRIFSFLFYERDKQAFEHVSLFSAYASRPLLESEATRNLSPFTNQKELFIGNHSDIYPKSIRFVDINAKNCVMGFLKWGICFFCFNYETHFMNDLIPSWHF